MGRYQVLLGQYKLLLLGIRGYRVSKGLSCLNIRVFHITPFFELSYTLLTTHAHGLYKVTKNISVIDSKLTFVERFLCLTLFTWEKGPK